MTDANGPLVELGKGFSGHATPTPKEKAGYLAFGGGWTEMGEVGSGPPGPEAVYSDRGFPPQVLRSKYLWPAPSHFPK